MRMLTASAIGLALALPLAVASAPARADDNGNTYTQGSPHWTQRSEQHGGNQGTDKFSYRQHDQRAGRASPMDRSANGPGQMAEGDRTGGTEHDGQRQDRYRHDPGYAGQHAQADGYNRGSTYAQDNGTIQNRGRDNGDRAAPGGDFSNRQ